MDEFFGPEETPHHLAGPGGLAGARGEGREGPAAAHQSAVTSQPVDRHLEPLYEQIRSAYLSSAGWEGQAEEHQSTVIPMPQPIEHHPEPLYEQARRAAGLDDWELPLLASQGRRR